MLEFIRTITSEDDDMRRLKKFAQVDLNGSEGLYETTADRFSRQAKHHLSQQEKINASMLLGLEIGDMVIYEGREAEVRIAQGPRATVGIIHEGNLKMVHESKVTRKVEEGVLGGVQAMPAINRMMQLAGLESGPVVVEENQTIMEDMGADMLGKMIAQAEQLPAYKGNAEAARFYVIGALLSAIGSNVNANPPQTVVGQSKKQELTPLATIGADLIKSSQDMTKGK
jgi:hypothetical protein